MAKVVGNCCHSDVILESRDGHHLPAHLCIIKCRAPGFFQKYVRPVCGNREPSFGQLIKVSDADIHALRFFMRCVYTEEEIPGFDPMPMVSVESPELVHSPSGSNSGRRKWSQNEPPHCVQEMTASAESAKTFILHPSSMQNSMQSSSFSEGSPQDLSDPQSFDSPTKENRKYSLDVENVQEYYMLTPSEQAAQEPTDMLHVQVDKPIVMTSFAALGSSVSHMSEEVNEPERRMSHTGATERRESKADSQIAKFVIVEQDQTIPTKSIFPENMETVDPQDIRKMFPMFFDTNQSNSTATSQPERPDSVRGSTYSLDRLPLQMGFRRQRPSWFSSQDRLSLSGSLDLPSPQNPESPQSEMGATICLGDLEQQLTDTENEAPTTKHGNDLLTMFLEGRDADCCILAKDGQIKAHCCILSNASLWLADKLNNAANSGSHKCIDLKEFSTGVVHEAMRCIYGGATNLPKELDLLQFLKLTQLLDVQAMRTCAILNIRKRYCHFFHKPCNGCVNGVLEILPALHEYQLQDLLDEACEWIAKYFVRIWQRKQFCLLDTDLHTLCYAALIKDLTASNLLDVVLACDKLQLQLPKQKYTEPVLRMVSGILDVVSEFAGTNFDLVLSTERFLSLAKTPYWNVSALEDVLTSSVHFLTPEIACRSFLRLHMLLSMFQHVLASDAYEKDDINERFVAMVKRLYEICDSHLLHHAAQVVKCDQWLHLTPAMQTRIKETGIFVEFRKPSCLPPRLSSANRVFKRSISTGPAPRTNQLRDSFKRDRSSSQRRRRTTTIVPGDIPSVNSNAPANGASIEQKQPTLSGSSASIHTAGSETIRIEKSATQELLKPVEQAVELIEDTAPATLASVDNVISAVEQKTEEEAPIEQEQVEELGEKPAKQAEPADEPIVKENCTKLSEEKEKGEIIEVVEVPKRVPLQRQQTVDKPSKLIPHDNDEKDQQGKNSTAVEKPKTPPGKSAPKTSKTAPKPVQKSGLKKPQATSAAKPPAKTAATTTPVKTVANGKAPAKAAETKPAGINSPQKRVKPVAQVTGIPKSPGTTRKDPGGSTSPRGVENSTVANVQGVE